MSTLQNFGVPLGGSSGIGRILQPKQKHKFRVIATNFGVPSGSIALTQQVQSVSRPNVNFQPVDVNSYNSRSYFIGRPEWEAINLVVRDDVTNAVSSLIGAQVQKQMNFFQQTTTLSGANYKFQMLIDTMDGGDDAPLEEWVLEGCFLASVNYEEFEYSSGDSMTIAMSIRYDNATQTGGIMPLLPQLTNIGDGFIA